jgi:hypothetical protein
MLQVFRRLCPSDAVSFHRGAIVERRGYGAMPKDEDVVDAEWKRM